MSKCVGLAEENERSGKDHGLHTKLSGGKNIQLLGTYLNCIIEWGLHRVTRSPYHQKEPRRLYSENPHLLLLLGLVKTNKNKLFENL